MNYDDDKHLDMRLNADAIIRPTTARDILDESITNHRTMLIVSQVVRVAGELPHDKSEAFLKGVMAVINKAEGRTTQ